MYLERLEIGGFKSFASKTILEFPHPQKAKSFGITAVVGPNGSGKSNILESIRWGLGEQSLKILRIKKSEDIIFSGSDKKTRLGSAEVSLHFNNEDGGAPIDYRQFKITRRIDRHGEGEYSINNNRVRLQNILILLAQSNFGQKSYSIIGQGTIDAILHSSATERKNFFDEATGIRQYQIKKEDALRKLEKSQINLQQAEVALREIEPRMRSLTRQIKKLERRQKFEEELKILQKKYYGNLLKTINNQLSTVNSEVIESEKKKDIIAEELDKLQKQLESMAYEKISDGYQRLQDERQKLVDAKNEYLEKIAILKGELIIEREKMKQDKKTKKVDPRRILADLEEIKNLHHKLIDALSQIKSLAEAETIKNDSLKIYAEIENLIRYLKNEEKEETLKPTVLKIEEEINHLNQEIDNLNGKIQLAGQKLVEFANQEQEKRKSLFDSQKKTQNKQMEFNALSNDLNNLRVEMARIETRKENLEEEIRRETNLEDFNQLMGQPSEETEPEKIFPEIQRLKHQLELIGGIDPDVAKEYPECRERWEFLTSQTKDLRAALITLNKIIKQLDEKIEIQFAQTFNKINEKFDYYFKVFFGGGKAKITLQKIAIAETQKPTITEAQNETEAQEISELQNDSEIQKLQDIEIMANPPGKKLKNIEALSGGERALTSLALICAIIATNKPPFVILDEVDAALDEENSARFANILKELAYKTQFIVITHNRQTMEVADTLYGVTMGKDSVSKLLSMRL